MYFEAIVFSYNSILLILFLFDFEIPTILFSPACFSLFTYELFIPIQISVGYPLTAIIITQLIKTTLFIGIYSYSRYHALLRHDYGELVSPSVELVRPYDFGTTAIRNTKNHRGKMMHNFSFK